MKAKITALRGVTLVEIAIVLVIIGLLLGGILKGQELINNAKVRAIADRQNSMKVAWFSFIDRFQALPGDYVNAAQYIPGAGNGDGNGTMDINESPRVLQHLTGAGYLRCPQCTASETTDPTAQNSLQNQYGGIMAVFSDENYYAANATRISRRLMVHTGPRIPSNIIAEVDRKLDDGVANQGDFVFNAYDASNTNNKQINNSLSDAAKECMSLDQADAAKASDLFAEETFIWRHIASSPPVEQDCGASINI